VQNILGYSATQAGATFLPMTVMIILLAPVAGKLSDRFGSRWPVAFGMTLISTSLVVDATFQVDSNFWDLLPALLLAGVGMAFAMAPTTAAAMGSVPVDKAGVGSAVLNSMRQVGGSLGIAIMGAIVASYVHVQPPDPRARDQFVQGFHHAVLFGAVITFVAVIVAVTTLRKYRHEGEAHAAFEGA
jgi:MFS family permease